MQMICGLLRYKYVCVCTSFCTPCTSMCIHSYKHICVLLPPSGVGKHVRQSVCMYLSSQFAKVAGFLYLQNHTHSHTHQERPRSPAVGGEAAAQRDKDVSRFRTTSSSDDRKGEAEAHDAAGARARDAPRAKAFHSRFKQDFSSNIEQRNKDNLQGLKRVFMDRWLFLRRDS